MGLKSFVLKKLAKIPGYQEVIHGKFKNPKQEGEGLFVYLFVCLQVRAILATSSLYFVNRIL